MALAGVALFAGIAWSDERARMCVAMIVCGLILSFGPSTPGYASSISSSRCSTPFERRSVSGIS